MRLSLPIALLSLLLLPAAANAQSSILNSIQSSIEQQDYTSALSHNDSLLNTLQRQGQPVSLPHYINRATLLRLSGRSDEAMRQFQNCLVLAEFRRDTASLAAICANMGNLLYQSGKHANASSLYHRSLAHYRALRDTLNTAMLLYQAAQCYLHEHTNHASPEAYGYLKRLSEIRHPAAQIMLAALNGQIALLENNFRAACEHFEQAWEHCQAAQNKGWQDNITLCFMELYAGMERARERGTPLQAHFCGKNETFLSTLQRAGELAERRMDLRQQTLAQFALARFFEHQKDLPRAFGHLNRYYALQEKLLAARSAEETRRMEIAYKTRDQKHQIDLLTVQSERERTEAALALQQRERALLEARTEAERRDHLLSLMATQRELDTCAIQSARVELVSAAIENARKNESIQLLSRENALHQAQNQRQQLLIALLLSLAVLSGILGRWAWRHFQERRLAALRARISRDLHDDLGSALSSIALHGMVAAELNDPSKMRHTLARISAEAQSVSAQVRDLTWSLHPASDSMDEMLARMRQFAQPLLEERGMTLRFEADEGLSAVTLGIEARRHFYLIFKEAVNNAAKYAAAQEVRVRISLEGKKLALEVTDDGTGFDPATAPRGNGLNNMAVRAELMGGSLRMDSAAGRGTRVRLECPMSG